jgi:hypothetical protein
MGGDLRLGILMQMEKAKWWIVVMRYGENADKVICGKAENERSRKDCLKVTFKPW